MLRSICEDNKGPDAWSNGVYRRNRAFTIFSRRLVTPPNMITKIICEKVTFVTLRTCAKFWHRHRYFAAEHVT